MKKVFTVLHLKQANPFVIVVNDDLGEHRFSYKNDNALEGGTLHFTTEGYTQLTPDEYSHEVANEPDR